MTTGGGKGPNRQKEREKGTTTIRWTMMITGKEKGMTTILWTTMIMGKAKDRTSIP